MSRATVVYEPTQTYRSPSCGPTRARCHRRYIPTVQRTEWRDLWHLGPAGVEPGPKRSHRVPGARPRTRGRPHRSADASELHRLRRRPSQPANHDPGATGGRGRGARGHRLGGPWREDRPDQGASRDHLSTAPSHRPEPASRPVPTHAQTWHTVPTHRHTRRTP